MENTTAFSGGAAIGRGRATDVGRDVRDLEQVAAKVDQMRIRAQTMTEALAHIANAVYGHRPEEGDSGNLNAVAPHPPGTLAKIHDAIECLGGDLDDLNGQIERLRQLA